MADNLIGKTVRILGEKDSPQTYTVMKYLPDGKVLIVNDPADPTILDSIPTSLLEVVD